MIKFQLTVNLGAQVYTEVELPLSEKTVLGSSEESDIVLQGDRVKAFHAELKVVDRQWHIRALDGEVRIAGKVVDDVLIELNKPVSVGPYILQVSLAQSEDGAVLLKESVEQKVGRVNKVASFFQGASSIMKVFIGKVPGGNKFISMMDNDLLKKLWLPEYRVRTILVAVIISLLFVFFGNDGGDKRDTVVEKYDIQTMRDIQRYQSWVEELLEKGDYQQALAILNAAIIKSPHVSELKQQREIVVEQFIDKSISSGQPEVAKKILASFDEGALVGEKTQLSVEKLDRVLQEKALHLANYEKNKKQFDLVISQVNAKMLSGDTEEAQFLLKDLSSVTGFEPDWQEKVAQLQSQIEAGLSALEKQRREEKLQEFEDRQLSMKLFNQCLTFYESGDFMRAYSHCKSAKNKSPVIELSTEIEVWLTVLEPAVRARMNKWSSDADECFNTGWMGCALNNWNKMLRNDPENEALQLRVGKVIDGQRKLAIRMFNEARAYADLGRQADAVLVLKELQKELPLTDEAIYQRAELMIKSLQ